VGGQAGIRDQAYQEGSLEVGSLEGVLAFRGAQNRSRQGDLEASFLYRDQQADHGQVH